MAPTSAVRFPLSSPRPPSRDPAASVLSFRCRRVEPGAQPISASQAKKKKRDPGSKGPHQSTTLMGAQAGVTGEGWSGQCEIRITSVWFE